MQCYVSFIINILWWYWTVYTVDIFSKTWSIAFEMRVWYFLRRRVYSLMYDTLWSAGCQQMWKIRQLIFFFHFQIQFTLFNVLPECFYIEHGWLVLRWHVWAVYECWIWVWVHFTDKGWMIEMDGSDIPLQASLLHLFIC